MLSVFMLFLAKEVQKTTVCFEWGPKIACLPMSHENIIPCIITGISMAALLTDSSQLFFFLPLFFLYRSGFLAAIHLLICIAEADLWDISLQQGDGAVWKQPTDCNSSCSFFRQIHQTIKEASQDSDKDFCGGLRKSLKIYDCAFITSSTGPDE